MARTVGDMGISPLVGTSRQPTHLAFGLDRTLDFLDAGMAGSRLLGQEDHTDAVFAGGRKDNALFGHFFAIELVGNLNEDAGAITLQRIGADGAAVIQVFRINKPCSTMP